MWYSPWPGRLTAAVGFGLSAWAISMNALAGLLGLLCIPLVLLTIAAPFGARWINGTVQAAGQEA